MIRLIVLLIIALLFPLLVIFAYALMTKGGRADWTSEKHNPSGKAKEWAADIAELMPKITQLPGLRDAPATVKSRVTWASQYAASGVGRALASLPIILTLAMVGLIRGIAARDHLIHRFGFSSPTRFLMAKGGLGLVLIATWLLSFVPWGTQLFSLTCLAFALLTLALSHMLAKHFPVVW